MVTDFQMNVYDACSRIPKGRVSTYKELAKALNSKGYRAVGSALNKNPFSYCRSIRGSSSATQINLVPCHRVVSSDGSLGGFAFGVSKKTNLLKKEGISVKANKIVDFDNVFFRIK